MTDTIDSEHAASASPARDTTGTRLRAAREAAGLSIESVAQQLKLAPRQVRALEDDDFQRLPGRTFVRGFARNYARFLQLDADTVVGLLPASESAPALSRPPLAATRRPMGEMPIEGAPRRSATRWLLPMLIVVVVAGAAYYEYLREHGKDPFGRGSATLASSTADAPRAPIAAASSTTALPNPVAPQGDTQQRESNGTGTTARASSASTPAVPLPASASTPSGATPGSVPASTPSGATPGSVPAGATSAAVPGGPTPAPASGGATSASASGAATSAPASGAATSAPAPSATAADTANSAAALVLAFKGTSWAEVKDANGRVILQMTGGAGMTQTVNGTPPFELALGNAPEVTVTFRGQTLDLAPYTRGSVARVALR